MNETVTNFFNTTSASLLSREFSAIDSDNVLNGNGQCSELVKDCLDEVDDTFVEAYDTLEDLLDASQDQTLDNGCQDLILDDKSQDQTLEDRSLSSCSERTMLGKH